MRMDLPQCGFKDCRKCFDGNCLGTKEYREGCDYLIADKELSSYRQAEEQGLLIKLPCKIGDTVYWISYFNHGINSGTVNSIKISKSGYDLEISNGDRTFWREHEKAFLTREAAESALKGGEGE